MTGDDGQFFPTTGELLVRSRDLDNLVWRPLGYLIGYYGDLGEFNRAEGFVRIEDMVDGGVIGEHVFGDRETWQFPYDQVVDNKGLLADDADGAGTQQAQLVLVTLVRSRHVPYFGTYEEAGIRVTFSGVQSFQDVNICRMAWAMFAVGYNRRKDLVAKVAEAVDAYLPPRVLMIYRIAMNVIEWLARAHGFHTLEEVCEYIFALDILRRTDGASRTVEASGLQWSTALADLDQTVRGCVLDLQSGAAQD